MASLGLGLRRKPYQPHSSCPRAALKCAHATSSSGEVSVRSFAFSSGSPDAYESSRISAASLDL